MKFFKTSESFFKRKKKASNKIKNPINRELQNQEEAKITDEIASRAAYAHSIGNASGDPLMHQ